MVGSLLVLGGIACHAWRMAVPPSELARKGSRSLGQILFKDSQPAADGKFTYSVTFVFADATHRNFQVTRVVPDKGEWDRLRTGAEVWVRYMPGNPEDASIAGAEGIARPHDAAYAFIAWSAIVFGVAVLAWSFRQANLAASQVEAETKTITRGGGA